MNNAALVGKPERASDIECHPGDLFDRQAAVATENLGQALAFDILHHDVIRAEFFAPVIDRDDVRVIQIRRRLGFSTEPLDERRIGCVFRKQDLDCDRTSEQLVARKKHVGHPTAGQPAMQLVSATKGGGALLGHSQQCYVCQP